MHNNPIFVQLWFWLTALIEDALQEQFDSAQGQQDPAEKHHSSIERLFPDNINQSILSQASGL